MNTATVNSLSLVNDKGDLNIYNQLDKINIKQHVTEKDTNKTKLNPNKNEKISNLLIKVFDLEGKVLELTQNYNKTTKNNGDFMENSNELVNFLYESIKNRLENQRKDLSNGKFEDDLKDFKGKLCFDLISDLKLKESKCLSHKSEIDEVKKENLALKDKVSQYEKMIFEENQKKNESNNDKEKDKDKDKDNHYDNHYDNDKDYQNKPNNQYKIYEGENLNNLLWENEKEKNEKLDDLIKEKNLWIGKHKNNIKNEIIKEKSFLPETNMRKYIGNSLFK